MQPQPSAGQPEQIQATARESSMYQAGYEAGRQSALREAAVQTASAGAKLAAAATTAANLQSVYGQVDKLLGQPGDLSKPKRLGAIRALAKQAHDLAVMLKDSMLGAQATTEAAAKAFHEQDQAAKQAFAEALARVQQLTPPAPPPRLRVRLFRALMGGQG